MKYGVHNFLVCTVSRTHSLRRTDPTTVLLWHRFSTVAETLKLVDIFVTDSMDLASVNLTQFAPKAAVLCKITHVYSLYATSYYCIKLTYVLSHTISEL